MTTEELKDPDELRGEQVLEVVPKHLYDLAAVLAEVRSPLPPGLSEGDRWALQKRRLELNARASYLHGMVFTLVVVARQARAITVEQYGELLGQLQKLVGG